MANSHRRGLRRTLVTTSNHGALRAFRRALALGTSAEGWLAIEGPILFAETLQAAGRSSEAANGGSPPAPAGLKIHSVLITEREAARFDEELDRLPVETEVTLVPQPLFKRVAQTETPQGVAALVELPEHSLDGILAGRHALLLVACGLQDPGNLGSMIRSAQALGGSALLTLRNTVSPFNPKAVRSSAGAVLRLPIFADLDWNLLLPRLHQAGLRVLAADRHSAVSAQEADLRGPLAVLIGREATGLDPELARQADASVAIPIRREADSLNAAAAAAVVLYEAARQRGLNEPL
jgi:RNA methyltransferase, TrmH family